ncbi:MAG: hypothetical protein IJL02_04055 [Methanobrevibacter sp.]|uniref:hypothetical protein n=1 Tax=Methanobrevibacter sp. TaxID=66852 RepID=UPI0025F635AD|nr:hypothetical protein [Methanobrevibacter sp.]MBQ6099018.1 hypothetical protein [Methanobrevibacter sp.]
MLCGVVLRLPSNDGKDIFKDIKDINKKLGETISKEFEDIMVVPFGMELVEDDMQVRILNKIEYNDEIPETDDEVEE